MSLYDDASLIMYPSGYKEDKIYSLKPTDGSGDLTFTRASSATRVNSDGFIEEVPYNLLQYSEQFDNAAWLKVGGAVTANAGVSPNGQTTADRFYIASAASNTRLYANYTFAAQEYTLSVYAKNNGSTDSFRFSTYDGVSQQFSSDFSLTNEWQRFTHTFTAATGAGAGVVWIANTSSTGVGSELDLLIWGAQLNSGSTAKTYFPTTDRLNVPRIDYTGGGCGKLLLEPQRTNLNTYSEDIPQNYVATEISDTFGYSTSPNGLQTSTRLQLSNLGSSRYVHTLTGIVSSGTSYNFSCYYKGTQGETAYMYALPVGGTAITKAITFTGEWQRENLTFTAGSASNYVYIVDSRQGGDASDFEVWGVQVEAGSYATSIINTAGSAVTRLADAAGDSNFTPSSNKATLFIEIKGDDNTINRNVCGFRNGTINQYGLFFWGSDNNKFGFNTWEGDSYGITNSTIFDGNTHKIAAVFDFSDFTQNVLYIDGVKQTISQTRGATLQRSQNKVSLSAPIANQNPIQEVINFKCFNEALTDTELATLTTL